MPGWGLETGASDHTVGAGFEVATFTLGQNCPKENGIQKGRIGQLTQFSLTQVANTSPGG